MKGPSVVQSSSEGSQFPVLAVSASDMGEISFWTGGLAQEFSAPDLNWALSLQHQFVTSCPMSSGSFTQLLPQEPSPLPQ